MELDVVGVLKSGLDAGHYLPCQTKLFVRGVLEMICLNKVYYIVVYEKLLVLY
ncbi:hypothetical protein HanXRQr2_Chr13g0592931 [Helianthus annuus]|uniref:Uncharacterized protein n=1 Tax=Helianthus annuus TaxID=4232 RepID=A0A9K3HCB6_HELAN|nr:hypothetical protein HanXRQr2_Chr13g0592931 [Helianthus annuus]KAJ0849623.1 hypothetical protein HanPSC8_Chr13g0570921 [Helianthus annuus]